MIVPTEKNPLFPLKPSYKITKIIKIFNFMFCCYSYFIIAFDECYKQKVDISVITLVLVLQLLLMYCQFITCRFKYGVLVTNYFEIAKTYLKSSFIIDLMIVIHYFTMAVREDVESNM